jgi:hypothetical protein
MLEAIATAVLLGGINTLIDFVSLEFKLETRPIYLLARVVLICYCTGLIVGARAKQILIGSITGIVMGLVLGAGYYMLMPVIGWWGLALTWTLFWVAFGLVDTLLQEGGAVTAILVSLAAAALSGLAFYAVSTVWSETSPETPSHIRGLVVWTSAFLPGFVVVFWRRG